MPKGVDTLQTRHMGKRDGLLCEYFSLSESVRHITDMARLPSVTKACSKIYCGMKRGTDCCSH